jgi:hypothetical protein
MVRAHAGAGGEHDRRHAGAEGEVNRVVGGELLRGEHRREDRHQGHAAADAEEPGEETDEGAGHDVGEHPGQDHRPSIAACAIEAGRCVDGPVVARRSAGQARLFDAAVLSMIERFHVTVRCPATRTTFRTC